MKNAKCAQKFCLTEWVHPSCWGTIRAEYPKVVLLTEDKAKRANKIMFSILAGSHEVEGSNLSRSTD